jgi:hypothetical protein
MARGSLARFTLQARRHYYVALMCFYLLFEIVPTAALLVCFWVWLKPGLKQGGVGRPGTKLGREKEPLINEP